MKPPIAVIMPCQPRKDGDKKGETKHRGTEEKSQFPEKGEDIAVRWDAHVAAWFPK